MPDKEYPYYKVQSYHREIFGTDEPCSLSELLFAVEAPSSMSGLDIYKFVEMINVEDLSSYYFPEKPCSFKINQDEHKDYPFYELFLLMWYGYKIYPLIFRLSINAEENQYLFCIEGRHRLGLLMLYKMLAPEVYQKRVGQIPIIIVEASGFKDTERYPEKHGEFCHWQSFGRGSLTSSIKTAKEVFSNFLTE